MAVLLNPYLSFGDNAREALEFYHGVFGGELELSTFGSMGMGGPDDAEKIMHGTVRTPDLTLMASDAPEGMEHSEGSSVSISLSGDDEANLRSYWNALSASGQISLPLEQAPWGAYFGMCVDQFGTAWMVNIDAPH